MPMVKMEVKTTDAISVEMKNNIKSLDDAAKEALECNLTSDPYIRMVFKEGVGLCGKPGFEEKLELLHFMIKKTRALNDVREFEMQSESVLHQGQNVTSESPLSKGELTNLTWLKSITFEPMGTRTPQQHQQHSVVYPSVEAYAPSVDTDLSKHVVGPTVDLTQFNASLSNSEHLSLENDKAIHNNFNNIYSNFDSTPSFSTPTVPQLKKSGGRFHKLVSSDHCSVKANNKVKALLRDNLKAGKQTVPSAVDISKQRKQMCVDQVESNKLDVQQDWEVDGYSSDNEVIDKSNLRPPYPFACLIALAIRAQETSRVTVSDIYAWIEENFPYFRTASSGWKNSVRHNLSLSKCFMKVARDKRTKEDISRGKGSFWGIAPDQENFLTGVISKCQSRASKGDVHSSAKSKKKNRKNSSSDDHQLQPDTIILPQRQQLYEQQPQEQQNILESNYSLKKQDWKTTFGSAQSVGNNLLVDYSPLDLPNISFTDILSLDEVDFPKRSSALTPLPQQCDFTPANIFNALDLEELGITHDTGIWSCGFNTNTKCIARDNQYYDVAMQMTDHQTLASNSNNQF